MSTRPDKTRRTRTPRPKRHIIVKPLKTRDPFESLRYDPDTGHIFERVTVRVVDLDTDTVRHLEHENPIPLGKMDRHGYIVIKWRGQSYPAHRLAYYLDMGAWPAFYIRHKNGLRFDNRECNIIRAGAKK